MKIDRRGVVDHLITSAVMIILVIAVFFVSRALLTNWRDARQLALQLNYMPAAFGDVTVAHVSQSDWRHDIGPGGNHALFLAFDLPVQTADEIAKSGIAFLAKATENGHGEVLSWQPTPVDQTDRRFVCRWPDVTCAGILDYATRYTPLENLEDSKSYGEAADKSLFAPGGYYAFTRLGLILVDPAGRRAYYASNG